MGPGTERGVRADLRGRGKLQGRQPLRHRGAQGPGPGRGVRAGQDLILDEHFP